MRLNVDNIKPKIVGLIYEDKAEHNHTTLAETLECLVKRAMGIVDDSTIEILYPIVNRLQSSRSEEEIKGMT